MERAIESAEDDHTWEKAIQLGNSQVKLSLDGDKITDVPTRVRSVVQDPKKELLKHELSKNPKVSLASVSAGPSGVIAVIDNYDKPANTVVEGIYARSVTYTSGSTDETGKRIPKAGAYAEAGVGRARAELSVLEAEAKGPNASAGAEASVAGVGAMARAEIGSVSVSVGPVGLKLGLGVDTGVSAGVDGVEVKLLGTGFRFGPRPSISFLGSEFECVIQ